MIFYSTSTISSRYLAFDDKNENGLSPELKTGPTFFMSINFTIVEKSASKAMWSRFVSLWEITRYLSLKGRGTKQSSARSVLTQNEHFKKKKTLESNKI